MNRKILLLTGIALVGIAALMFILFRPGAAQEPAPPAAGQSQPADPQKLLIPRWFLRAMTVDGREVPIEADQQKVTIQFAEDGSANGTASCNSFFTNYEAGKDGQMLFGPIGATKMWCDQMPLESDYFEALSQVQRYNTDNNQLTLTSEDGSTTLVFAMPPK
jgi:heat shock protein HslJ